ncbi:O-fucosyltransferase 9 [Ranunculus cassubicifolius]
MLSYHVVKASLFLCPPSTFFVCNAGDVSFSRVYRLHWVIWLSIYLQTIMLAIYILMLKCSWCVSNFYIIVSTVYLRGYQGSSELPRSNGFLIIEANGGLNQQRISICDAVAVAGLLNATLVIPMFHLNSVWRDSSNELCAVDQAFFFATLISMAVRIAPFSNRLAHAVPSNIQDLRCFANYEALRFSQPIRTLAERMVDRMVTNSSISGGKYISVHLQFEEDMVAFSCCTYDGGEEEKHEMDIARERSWRGKFRKHGRIIRPGAIRVDGKCPLTPLEVGMMLRAMGYDNTTSVYVAAGKFYRADKYTNVSPLRQMFPLLETKETLASQAELAPFVGYSSRLAALDYTVCLHSEVFVTTQGGNLYPLLKSYQVDHLACYLMIFDDNVCRVYQAQSISK